MLDLLLKFSHGSLLYNNFEQGVSVAARNMDLIIRSGNLIDCTLYQVLLSSGMLF